MTKVEPQIGLWGRLVQLFQVVSPSARREMLLFIFVSVLAGFSEVLGITAILPFMSIITNPALLETNAMAAKIYQTLDFQSEAGFFIFCGGITVAALALSNALTALSLWLSLKIAYMESHELSVKLLKNYLYRPYAWFLGQNHSTLGQHILAEVSQVTYGFFLPITQVLAKGVRAGAIVLFLFWLNPWVALFAGVFFGGIYSVLYAASRALLRSAGERRVESNRHRYLIAIESLSGIAETKVYGCEESFLGRFSHWSELNARDLVRVGAVSNFPRYAIEVLAVAAVVAFGLHLALGSTTSASSLLPMLSLYVVAGYRLMPALQGCFASASQFEFASSAVARVLDPLSEEVKASDPNQVESIQLKDTLSLSDVSFRYPEGDTDALKRVTLDIKVGERVGFVGESGSGKTTLTKILLGLLTPASGEFTVDGRVISSSEVSGWQRKVGYVPQSSAMLDATIASNVAYGIPPEDIDLQAVEVAVELACAHEFIGKLPLGLQTEIGDRGVRLSGGQKQRLLIARALYRNPEVLVFDEATSALDNVTEQLVMDALAKSSVGRTVIIVAHRLSTVESCDRIYLFDEGVIADEGPYEELLKKSERFQRLVSGLQENNNAKSPSDE